MDRDQMTKHTRQGQQNKTREHTKYILEPSIAHLKVDLELALGTAAAAHVTGICHGRLIDILSN